MSKAGWNSHTLAIASFVGLTFAKLNGVVWFVWNLAGWWMGVRHVPFLVIAGSHSRVDRSGHGIRRDSGMFTFRWPVRYTVGSMESDVTSRTLDELQGLYAGSGLSALFEQLKPYAKQAIAIDQQPVSDSSLRVGGSRLGGLPDLPHGQGWFVNTSTGDPLNFVGQINLSEVAGVAESPLPTSGMLSFFYDLEAFGWGFEPAHRHGQRVFFFEGPMEELTQTPAPSGIEVYELTSLSFVPTLELPDVASDLVDLDLDLDLDDDEYEKLLDLMEDFDLKLDNKLLGHSDNVQEGMELQCELASSGISCGTSEILRNAGIEVRERARQWNLLLQVESNELNGMKWGGKRRMPLLLDQNR